MIRDLLILFASALATPVIAAETPVSFRRDVLPLLTKSGCNAGACHGSPTGKNGFRLSLRGYDPALDLLTLTREDGGRRLDRINPAASAILVKPTCTTPHEGGGGSGSIRRSTGCCNAGSRRAPATMPPIPRWDSSYRRRRACSMSRLRNRC